MKFVFSEPLTQGQTVEYVYPETTALSESDRVNLAFLSFPDSNDCIEGDTSFAFVFKRPEGPIKEQSLFGMTFYRQRPDPTNQRGHSQCAIVVLMRHSYVDVTEYITSIVGPTALEHTNVLEIFKETYRSTTTWPAPLPGSVACLPLLGTVGTFALPRPKTQTCGKGKVHASTQMHDLGDAYAEIGHRMVQSPPAAPRPRLRRSRSMSVHGVIPACPIPGAPRPGFSYLYAASDDRSESPMALIEHHLPVCGPQTLITHFGAKVSRVKSQLESLWACFEAVLTGRSILVFGAHPRNVGLTVLGLLTLTDPCPFGGDYRPYLPIYDRDFDKIFTTPPPKATIVGVTNPVCERWLESWDVVIHLATPTKKFKIEINFPTTLAPDSAVIKNANKCRGADDIEAVVRNHFGSLMDEFLTPFDRYFRPPLINTLAGEAFLQDPQPIDSFSEAELLANIGKPKLFSMKRRDWRAMYRAFIDSPSCRKLLEIRADVTPGELRQVYRMARISLNVDTMCAGKDATECYVLTNTLSRLLLRVAKETPDDVTLIQALNTHRRRLAILAEERAEK
ncbi:Stabilization of polarity axis [Carpediemonas membranifera]|uniref:Stabilization of polarity axis n=1 Tax=Carpediemonas membranifera TaxID=201153 RepID=A0A8J6AWX3_9EUKA|nr:Stabilization of polarity axis [Carpediemonas membranifera]|eukprot:KAG9390363.1 Stabilization of polarity axis [Carpediemonas membranifera]